jgi:hypothetical protein
MLTVSSYLLNFDIDGSQLDALFGHHFIEKEGEGALPNFGLTTVILCFQGKNLLVIGTTSEVGFLESIGMCDVFSVTYHVPKLKKEDAKKVRK